MAYAPPAPSLTANPAPANGMLPVVHGGAKACLMLLARGQIAAGTGGRNRRGAAVVMVGTRSAASAADASDVDRHNFESALPAIEDAIAKCTFMAIDCEMCVSLRGRDGRARGGARRFGAVEKANLLRMGHDARWPRPHPHAEPLPSQDWPIPGQQPARIPGRHAGQVGPRTG